MLICIGSVLLHLLSLMFCSAFIHGMVMHGLDMKLHMLCHQYVSIFLNMFHSNLSGVFIHVLTHVCCLHAFKCEFAQYVLLHVHIYIGSVYSCASCSCFNSFLCCRSLRIFFIFTARWCIEGFRWWLFLEQHCYWSCPAQGLIGFWQIADLYKAPPGIDTLPTLQSLPFLGSI